MCDRVVAWLDRNGLPYVIDLLLDPETHDVTPQAQPYYELAKQRGASAAPIVVVLDEQDEIVDIFGGFNPTKLKELKHV
jgi:hypothetical protein